MKTFKSFIQLDEVERVKYKDGIANKMANATDEVKTKGNRLDNKQAFGEQDLTAKQTKISHAIGKELEKKKVGDPSKGGPYAIATAMVKDKPEAAQKAYATIKSKMKEDVDAMTLFKLYEELNDANKEVFMKQLDEDAEVVLAFAKTMTEE
jgi:hypothetical protein